MQPLIQFCPRCQKSHQPGAHSARVPAAPKPTPAENEQKQRVTIQKAVQMSGGKLPSLTDAILIDAAEIQAAPKKEKPVKKKATKKPKSGSRVSTTRVQTRAAKRPQPRPGKAPSPSKTASVDFRPQAMSRTQLEAYVAADMERKAAARAAKAKAQAKWRKGLK